MLERGEDVEFDTPKWESVKVLQKMFMMWFNNERLKNILTFPVESFALVQKDGEFIDEDSAKFVAKMYSEGHSFFTYRSDSVDSLSSCCFDGSQMTLTRSSNGINYMSFKDLYSAQHREVKRNFTIFHNGSWVGGKVIKVPAKKLFKVTTVNNKEMLVTADHLNPTIRGDVRTDELTTDDFLLTNSCPLNAIPERDLKLSYEQGFLIGMYLGDGSIANKESTIALSLNEEKYINSINILQRALRQMEVDSPIELSEEINHVYPVRINSYEVVDFVREYVDGKYACDKRLDLKCLEQSLDFRKGILDGYCMTDGGNSNRIYTTSEGLVSDVEALITSIGLNSIINVSDRTDEPVIIRGEPWKRNYPLYCIRWYERKNKRNLPGIFKTINNSTYFKIKSIEEYNSDDEYVYCFEMANEDEPYFTLPNGIITHNCRLKNQIKDNTFSFTLGAGGVATGSKGVITMDVNRLVQNAVKSGRDISECVREQVEKIHCYLSAYNEIAKDYLKANMLPVYEAGFISLDRQYLTVGINGFAEGAEFLGIDISPNEEYFKYGESILKPIYESNRAAKTEEIMFNTEFVPKMSGHIAVESISRFLKFYLIDLETQRWATGRKRKCSVNDLMVEPHRHYMRMRKSGLHI